MDLNHAFYFVNVAEKQGFSAAARALGIPKSRISRHVRQLEESLDTRLLQRNSRHLSLTEAGKAYLQHARAALDCMATAEAAVRRGHDILEGSVTLSCSVGVAQFAVSRLLPLYLAENPGVVVRQQVSNAFADLIGDGVDIAIRGHVRLLPDSQLIQRRVAVVPWHLFASPGYLESHGTPGTPEELEGRAALTLGWRPDHDSWSLQDAGGTTATVPHQVRLRSDDMATLKQAAAEGLGIVALPHYVCRDEVAAGQLCRLLPDWTAGLPELSLLMPSRKGVPPQVEAMVAFLRKQLPTVVQDSPIT
ncbi:MAG: LysR family transcriptional regulator [Minwuia thermotolerans]|nr:MAG: LysR family transcriptional regulator [Minwuia thermotolerans]